jgi:hypothetical protein
MTTFPSRPRAIKVWVRRGRIVLLLTLHRRILRSPDRPAVALVARPRLPFLRLFTVLRPRPVSLGSGDTRPAA